MKRSVTKKPRLTKWFDGSKFVPYHVGEYNSSFEYEDWRRRWWDGKFWRVEEGGIICKIQDRNFRGLAQNPEVQP